MRVRPTSDISLEISVLFDKEKTMKKIINSRDIQKDADDYTNRRMDAEKEFASMGMTLESFERPISESEIPTRLD